MRLYETTFLINPQTDDATIDKHVQSVKDVISNQGGKVVLDNRMGTRRLAYEIDGLTQAYYTNLIFEAPAKALSPLERHFRLGEVYLRNLTVLFEGNLEQMLAEAREVAEATAQPQVTTEAEEAGTRREEAAPGAAATETAETEEEPKREVETVAEPAVKGETSEEAEEALKPDEPEGEPVPGAVETETEEVEERVREEETPASEESQPAEQPETAEEETRKPEGEGKPANEASETHYDEEEQL